jgi:fumarate reductase flavoprotein subunit
MNLVGLGLKVNSDAAVLDKEGNLIPGLYAAGGAAVGISGHGSAGYLAGNGLLAAVGFAYLAAKAIAKAS